MGKLLICDPVDASSVEAIRATGIEVDVRDDISLEELAEVIGDYEGMVVRSRTKVRAPLIDKAGGLKLIIRGGVGLDSIDVAYAESKGIDVRNTPAASSNAVAELAVGMMFALCRNIAEADATMKAGKWEKKKYKGTELLGKTLGVIGYGRIGRAVGEKAKVLGMQVIAYDPYVTHPDVGLLEDVVKSADIITLHLPHTPQTHHILGSEQFAAMKPGVMLVQVSRGGTVDEQALYDAMEKGTVSAAALDVYTEEPPVSEFLKRLVALPQVIATPHIGAATVEAQTRIGDEIVKLAVAYLQ
ncbi:MAG: D-2-hydroxyacid dehydrogenase [Anaerolineae bacterium]|nr:D-2-hydroxyacid dehydrogenase [Anaerolineae bacterium]